MTQTPARTRCRLTPEQLRRTCDLSSLPFKTTADLPPFDGLIGQERALRALQFGLQMRAPGYHVFVAGSPGTGKTSHTRVLVSQKAAKEPAAPDWCYVYNFQQPDVPLALRLKAGKAPAFAADVAELVRDLFLAFGRLFQSAEYREHRTNLIGVARQQLAGLMGAMEQVAASQGFSVQQTEQGLALMPLTAGEEPPEAQERKVKLQDQLQQTMAQVWQVQKAAETALRDLDGQAAQLAVLPVFEAIRKKYARQSAVLQWLEQMASDVLLHHGAFRPADADGGAAPAHGGVDPVSRYRVQVLVTHRGRKAAPVVVESSPTFGSLFGRLDQSGQAVDPAQAMRALSPGALHRASGGYLILQVEECLVNPYVWEMLKRCLLASEVAIRPVPDQPPPQGPVLRPQPIPIDVKVILIGPLELYAALWQRDETFRKLFKVRAEFDTTLAWNDANVADYLSFLGTVCRRDKLPHLDRSAAAELIEYAARLTDDQSRLSSRFNQVLEVLYEACALAGDSPAVSREHVQAALAGKRDRAGRAEDQYQAMFARGHLLIDIDGAEAGQVNGLTVFSHGDNAFGIPSRVTARVWLGRSGIVHIEKETQMSGHIHNKGVLTLSGFLGDHFAQDKPLALSASLSFEQMYGGVEGDSASSTELYALLSALAGVPIQQGIAVTGSVNQAGDIQPVGGVNQKVEGFFRVCQARGLTGHQGVMIPIQNAENLMLDRDVVQAVAAGQFHIWAIRYITEGIEILTGIEAGERQPGGGFTPGSLFDRVDRRLRVMAESLRTFEGAV